MPIYTVDFEGSEKEKEQGRASSGFITIEADSEENAEKNALDEVTHVAMGGSDPQITKVELAGPNQIAAFEEMRRRN